MGEALKSPPKRSGSVPAQVSATSGGVQYFLGRAGRIADGGVEVCDAQAGGGAGECHDAPLGAALVKDEIAALGDVAEGGVATEEDEVGAALVGADQVGVEAGEAGAQAGEGVA